MPDQDLNAVTEDIISGPPEYSVIGEGEIVHTLWMVSDVAKIAGLLLVSIV